MKIADAIRELDDRIDDLDYCSRQLDFYAEKDKVARDRYVIAKRALWKAKEGLIEYQKIVGTDLPIDWSRTWEKG